MSKKTQEANIIADIADRFEPTEDPIISPHFVVVLGDHCSQAILDWLIANAPQELVELFHDAANLSIYHEEFYHSDKVSPSHNSTIMDIVRRAINTLDKMGVGNFESMG